MVGTWPCAHVHVVIERHGRPELWRVGRISRPLDSPHDLKLQPFQPFGILAPYVERNRKKGPAVRRKQDDLSAERIGIGDGANSLAECVRGVDPVTDRCCLLAPRPQTGSDLNTLYSCRSGRLQLVGQLLRKRFQGPALAGNGEKLEAVCVQRRVVGVEGETGADKEGLLPWGHQRIEVARPFLEVSIGQLR